MTVKEAIQMAEQGDTGAMCSLGDYYSGQNTVDGMENAAKWYGMAAERDVPYAVHAAVITKRFLAIAHLEADIALGNLIWNDEKEEWEEVYRLVSREIKMLKNKVPGSEGIDVDVAIKNYYDVEYHLALCYYELGNYQEVIDLLEGRDGTRAKILYASAVFSTPSDDNERIRVLQQYKCMEGDIEYASSSKSKYEEKEYAIAAMMLTQVYRLGMGEPQNLEKAVKLLNFVRSYLSSDEMKELIDEELKHYQKKLFGGYKYV